jgi:hypothetical protein
MLPPPVGEKKRRQRHGSQQSHEGNRGDQARLHGCEFHDALAKQFAFLRRSIARPPGGRFLTTPIHVICFFRAPPHKKILPSPSQTIIATQNPFRMVKKRPPVKFKTVGQLTRNERGFIPHKQRINTDLFQIVTCYPQTYYRPN